MQEDIRPTKSIESQHLFIRLTFCIRKELETFGMLQQTSN